MPRLIDTNGLPVVNPWQLLPKDATLETALALDGTALLVPAALWNAHKTELQQSGRKIGVWLDSDEHAALIAGDVASLPLVALNFPGFMDGRPYSTAAVLRTHHGYQGELRAIGDVLRDQLFYLKRCGFTTFDLKDTVKLKDAQKALSDFTTNYQGTVEEPLPLFLRREAGQQ